MEYMIKENILTRNLANGVDLSLPIFRFVGSDKSSPSVYIQSGIHGSEVQGYLVSLYLIEHFRQHQPKGNVIIVPIANPYGLNCKMGEYSFGRFDPVTGDNWNRNYQDLSSVITEFMCENIDKDFKSIISLFRKTLKQITTELLNKTSSYHKKLAIQLHNLAIEADIVLDLHCDTISVPHIYCPAYAIKSAPLFNIPFIIEIPHVFAGALDEAIFMPWVTLIDNYGGNDKFSVPVEAFTLELGNQEAVNPESAYEQSRGILNYLHTKGAIDYIEKFNIKSVSYTCKLADFITIYAPSGGVIIDKQNLGEPVSKNTPLVFLNNPNMWGSDNYAKFTHSVTSKFDSIPITSTASAIVHEGMALTKVMTNYQQSS